MHPDTREVAKHMKEFGLCVLGRAIYDATFSEMGAPFAHAMAVVHAGHGAEIVLKARIAEEHPLLIFEKLPATKVTDGHLTLAELFEHGRSCEYAALPNLLWAATGYRMKHLDQYQDFGRLRNLIVHFAVPNVDLSDQALRFCLQVMEPVIDDFWKDTALTKAEEFDTEIIGAGYLRNAIGRMKLEPRVRQKIDKLTTHPQELPDM